MAKTKNAAAVELALKRAKKLSAKRRKEIAQQGAAARWGRKPKTDKTRT